MRKLSFLLATLLLFNNWIYAQETELDSAAIMKLAYKAYVDSIENTLNYEYGKVELDGGVATITVPEGYKFLGSEQANYVLTELWGNPQSETLGMLFPKDISPLSDNFTYAVEVSYSEEGYIDDEDAEDIDYQELLEDMQSDIKESNSARVEQGYSALELVGWASEPFYDTESKKLHWAKELNFDGAEVNTLNYNIRVLGRKGYLNMNAIGDIDILSAFNQDRDKILASVEFNDGYKYSDFNPDIDKVAAYGIGGLIAGKVLAKAGFFALLLKFWKFIALGAVAFFGVLKKMIFGSNEEDKQNA